MAERRSYEEALIHALRTELDLLPIPGLTVDSIEVEGTGPDASVVLLFHHDSRPGCRFGFRCGAWDESTPHPAPDSWVPVIWALLDERINASDCGLPADCPSGTVLWLAPCGP